jgi:mannose-1-phosphate guanylyltransferase/mannose-6-phosphate isomerase
MTPSAPPIVPVIVCGGTGTRLWPLSRGDRPKQFLRLAGNHSTFQEAVRRVCDSALFTAPMIITNRDHHSIVMNELSELGVEPDEVLLEPLRRGSGPGILAGTLRTAARHGADTVILALAADHVIRDVEGFRRTCRQALAVARKDAIVTFGIVPDNPATTYGYIEPGESVAGAVRRVRRFIEKPDAETAAVYMSQGFYWNSGNFLFPARLLVDEYQSHDAKTAGVVALAVEKAVAVSHAIHLETEAFSQALVQSIDHAVMEKTARATVIPADFDWTDIGSWSSLHRLLSEAAVRKDEKVRSLTFKPGDALDSQPLLVGEYWIVTDGVGTVTVDGSAKTLRAVDYIHVPRGARGQITNPGPADLRMIVASD